MRPMELTICDEGGKALAAGETGEIVIKGGNVMRGYWKNESSTKEVIREGWLYTGDLGYVDSDGFLMVLGRFKSLLIANDGEKYSPEGIEEAIVEKSKFIDYCILYNDCLLYTSLLPDPVGRTGRCKMLWLSLPEYQLPVLPGSSIWSQLG